MPGEPRAVSIPADAPGTECSGKDLRGSARSVQGSIEDIPAVRCATAFKLPIPWGLRGSGSLLHRDFIAAVDL